MPNVPEILVPVDDEIGTRTSAVIGAVRGARTVGAFRRALGLLALLGPVAVLALVAPAARAQASRATLPAWMAGCWARRTATTFITEQWSQPRAGMMLGAGHTTRGDSTLEFEHTRIIRRGETLVYAAQPSGQAATEFIANGSSDTLIVFANPAHDFPQRVMYRRRGSDSLLARIEGARGGRVRGIDFPYARVPCTLP